MSAAKTNSTPLRSSPWIREQQTDNRSIVFAVVLACWLFLSSLFFLADKGAARALPDLAIIWGTGLFSAAGAWWIVRRRSRLVCEDFAAFFDESPVPMILVDPRPLREWAKGRGLPPSTDYLEFFSSDARSLEEVTSLAWFAAANNAILRLFGARSFAELSSRRRELFSSAALALSCAELVKTSRTPAPGRIDLALKALNAGGERAVEAYWIPLAPTFVRRGVILVSFFDVTAQRRTALALREQEARIRTLMLAVPVGVCVVSGARNIAMVNDRLCEQTGYSREELLGAPSHILYPDSEEFDRIGHSLFAGCRKDVSTTASGVFRRKDGVIRDVVLSAAPLDPLAPDKGIICAIQDTTDMRRNELERQQLELQLAHAQKMEFLGRIVAGLAHDYQSVLLALRIQLDQYRLRANLGPEDIRTFESLSSECRRGIELSKRMLLFGRQDPPAFSEVNLGDLAASLLPVLKRLAGDRISLRFDCTDQSTTVWGDALMLDQALLNLVSNARDAMPGGGVLHIELSVAAEARRPASRTGGRPCVKIEVSDTGTGIDQASLKKIFEPFFTTKAKGAGSGLGLMIVENVARAHFGWVELSSELGRGTSFRIYVPLLEKRQPLPRTTGEASRS